MGDRLFSFAFSQVAPYFWTIRPRFTVIEPNHAEVVIPKRRGVKNHIGTVHAIALCNGLEAAMGVLAEASIPSDKRWIPKGMEVSYTAKATTDITCIAETDPEQWTGDDPDVPVRVQGRAQGRHRRHRGHDQALGDAQEEVVPRVGARSGERNGLLDLLHGGLRRPGSDSAGAPARWPAGRGRS